jgi:short-subunit dehydrogenase
VILAARDAHELRLAAADLRIRHGVGVAARHFDALDFDSHPAFFDDCAAHSPGGLAGVVLCHGYMAEQQEAQRDPALARRMIDTNFTSAVSVLEHAAAHFERRGRGFICAISSVAGDRGRQSNYLYGSSKGALTVYLQGLRNRMSRCGVPVTTVKPGFVDTGMTWGLLEPGSPLVATRERVARDVYRAAARGKDVLYTPWFWRGIMAVITSIPERVFKRMKL